MKFKFLHIILQLVIANGKICLTNADCDNVCIIGPDGAECGPIRTGLRLDATKNVYYTWEGFHKRNSVPCDSSSDCEFPSVCIVGENDQKHCGDFSKYMGYDSESDTYQSYANLIAVRQKQAIVENDIQVESYMEDSDPPFIPDSSDGSISDGDVEAVPDYVNQIDDEITSETPDEGDVVQTEVNYGPGDTISETESVESASDSAPVQEKTATAETPVEETIT
ncbi:hypothetical protein BC833DRAFT_654307, partial [Globomyces pollinis-pini]